MTLAGRTTTWDALRVEELNCTDLGNAARFARDHGKKLSHDGAQWLLYDSGRWAPASDGAIHTLVKKTLRGIAREAADEPSSAQRAELLIHAFKSEKAPRIKAMVELAKGELFVARSRFDLDPWILNCQNGTVDLRTGELRPHEASDHLTRQAGAAYDPDARSALWDRVLGHALPDATMRDYFQRLAGYTAAGVASEDVFVLLHGPTRTSKGTCQGAISAALGTYAIAAEIDLLAARDRADASRPRPELYRLQGARMVSIYETERSLTLSAGLVKSLTGSDPITARDLYSKPVTFTPQCCFWIASNNLPNAPAGDGALWERVRLMPFDQHLTEGERDRTVRQDLTSDPEHLAAVLTWTVDGALLWLAGGLAQPDAVRAAGVAYRQSQNPLHDFAAEHLVMVDKWTSTAELRAAYEDWCKEAGESSVSDKAFKAGLLDLGAEDKRKNKGRGWQGVALRGSHLSVVAKAGRVTGDSK